MHQTNANETNNETTNKNSKLILKSYNPSTEIYIYELINEQTLQKKQFKKIIDKNFERHKTFFYLFYYFATKTKIY